MSIFSKYRHSLSFFSFLFILLFFSHPADAISISQEKKLARKFMKAIEKQDKIIQDSISQALVSEIGRCIVKKLPPQPFQYSFYIMDDEQFNAFAGPGANIFLNRGLITSLDNVDELAGIIGHEIAHASCRHISDMVDQSKLMNIATLAGVLAGVLVGVSSGEGAGADLGQAVAIGSMAAGQTLMLSYSREHETEADQKGLGYIQASGFDPAGLLTGLEKIRSRDWYGSESVPDYLKTHPGSTERIVYIQSWMDSHGKESRGKESHIGENSHLNDRQTPVDPFRFAMVKARLAGIYGNEDEMEKKFKKILEKNSEKDLEKDQGNCAAHYGMALVLERKTRLKESLNHLRQALVLRAFDPFILIEMGRINVLAGNAEKALQIIQGLEQVPEVKLQAWFVKAQAQLMLGMFRKAEKGFARVIEQAPRLFPKAYYHMAQIKGEQQGETSSNSSNNRAGSDSADSSTPPLSHYYLGIYYYKIKNMKNARFHLKKSMKKLSDSDKKEYARKLLDEISNKK